MTVGAVALVVASGCAAAPAVDGSCDLSGFLAVQHAHVNRAEVTLCGTVDRVRSARRTRSGEHRLFYVDVGHGNLVEIDANLDVLGTLPVRAGERTTIRGEYYYDSNGREGVHWTHHTSHGSHPGGYVILEGTRYE